MNGCLLKIYFCSTGVRPESFKICRGSSRLSTRFVLLQNRRKWHSKFPTQIPNQDPYVSNHHHSHLSHRNFGAFGSLSRFDLRRIKWGKHRWQRLLSWSFPPTCLPFWRAGQKVIPVFSIPCQVILDFHGSSKFLRQLADPAQLSAVLPKSVHAGGDLWVFVAPRLQLLDQFWNQRSNKFNRLIIFGWYRCHRGGGSMHMFSNAVDVHGILSHAFQQLRRKHRLVCKPSQQTYLHSNDED